MTHAHKDQNDAAGLDAALSRLADDRGGAPSAALMARVLADAAAEQQADTRGSLAQPSFGQTLSDMLGGWRGFGGLALASCTGLFLGVAQPAGLDVVSAALAGDQLEVGLGLSIGDLGLEVGQ